MSVIAADDVRVLLCDADGNIFPSEEPAFEASAQVTNRLLGDLGVDRRYAPAELRALAVGRSFRAAAMDLAAAHGVDLDADELERRVTEERRHVTARLRRVLAPDRRVREPLERLASRMDLALVSSSALARLDACITATGLGDLFPAAARFSAEDSLPVATSKPDPAVYALAIARLGVRAGEALAVEDAVAGVGSAVGAGVPVVGNLLFVPAEDRAARAQALRAAGAAEVVTSWHQLEALLTATAARSSARRRRTSRPARHRADERVVANDPAGRR